MSVTLQWNDKGLQSIFDALEPKAQMEFHKKAQRATAKDIAKFVKQNAAAQGLGVQGATSKNGWRWVRYGRVAASVDTGKLWARGSRQTIRIFNRGGKRASFMKSAPHAHLVILGHKKYLPKPDGSTVLVGKTTGVPIYQAAKGRSEILFYRNLEKSVGAMIKRLNKQGKL